MVMSGRGWAWVRVESFARVRLGLGLGLCISLTSLSVGLKKGGFSRRDGIALKKIGGRCWPLSRMNASRCLQVQGRSVTTHSIILILRLSLRARGNSLGLGVSEPRDALRGMAHLSLEQL
jgi:hypothetical protein